MRAAKAKGRSKQRGLEAQSARGHWHAVVSAYMKKELLPGLST
jgi:hypothetical protein